MILNMKVEGKHTRNTSIPSATSLPATSWQKPAQRI